MVKILCLGGSDAPWHKFSEYQRGLSKILKDLPLDILYTQDLDSLIPSSIKDFDHIICCVSEKHLSADQEKGLLAAISGFNPELTGEPKHFFGFHCAATAFQNSWSYSQMLGARFLAHPPMGIPFEVLVTEPAHEICNQMNDFFLVDELYLLELYGMQKTLFHTEYGEFNCPLGWIKPYGLGKVGYVALGHGEEQLIHRNTSNIIRNYVRWLIHTKTFD